MMKKVCFVLTLLMALTVIDYVYAYLDDFSGTALNKMWTLRDPAKKAAYKIEGGKMILDIKASADMFRKGVDAGVMLLTQPPNMANFTVDLMVNPSVKGTQPPACHVGIVFFNEADWAYSAWGPYNAGADIRLEDCINADYRWRNETKIGIDKDKVAVDKDVYLRVKKTGNKLEFLAKGAANEQWVSAGADEKLGTNYASGKYKIGIIAKSWGGSVDSTFEFDFFDVPELSATAVSNSGKLIHTWAGIKH